jgi:hypothetical protein
VKVEHVEPSVCPLTGDACRGALCAAAVVVKRGKRNGLVYWSCGLVRAGRDDGRVIVDVTRREK